MPDAPRPVRVLLVEDDPADAARLVAALERSLGAIAAARVQTAEAFRDRLAASSWDAIIAEHALGGFCAADALATLQATGRDVPFIVVSGSLRVDEAVDAMRRGARDYLPKSDLSRLGPLVERELREAAVRRELRESERARAQERIERDLVAKQLEIIRTFGNDILLILAADGRIVEANDRAVAAYGWSLDELLRLNARELRTDEVRGGFDEELRRTMAEGGSRFRTWHRRRSGEPFPVEVSARPMEVAGQVLVQSIIRDLTGEEAARAAVEREALLVEHLRDAVIGLDGALRVTAWNPAAERLLGVPRGEALGRPLAALVETACPGGGTLADLARDAEARGSIRVEVRQRPRAGEPVEGELTLVAVRGREGIRYVVVLRDIGPQRRAFQELVQAQKMEAVGRLASGVAHDFNNLLVAILTGSTFLAEALPDGDPRRRDAEDIHEAGERASALVRQLLAFARRSATTPVPTDLNAVIAGFEKLLRRTIGEDVRVEVRLGERLWPVRIDPGSVEQVVMNLAVNARDAMPGGGTLTIETRNEEVAPGADAAVPAGRYAVLVVEDSGIGIPADVLPRIFEPFFTTKRPGQGTGLGLSTVHGILEQARGLVAVSSAPGRGTRFTIRLPACEEAPAPAPGPAVEIAARGRGERVLLVEDDDAVRATLRRLLERGGYEVAEATNGREALDRFRASPDVALVLSDSVMPEGSGRSLAEAIRAGPRAVPVVLMSGYRDREVGPEPVLAKPFTAGALLGAVRRALDARGAPA